MSHSESDAGKSKKWLKYVLVGDSGVGKTCLLVRFVDGEFLETVPTIAVDFRTKAISVGGETVKLQVCIFLSLSPSPPLLHPPFHLHFMTSVSLRVCDFV
eukprot:TRINITY_DN1705_c0_g1_i2.p1 TRINITY_DN1705_c0_g1~~TRINITY_DN1705_c0_g1_i2.p1  ORF type:complete len:100 (-),score=29.57 TRINITY_DN1705_c0_g1_i2:223-522(-)